MASTLDATRLEVEAHRREGGDPEADTAYRYLHAFFEPDDELAPSRRRTGRGTCSRVN